MNKKVLIVGSAFVLVAAALVFLLINPAGDSTWTEAEATGRVESLYGGKIGEVNESGQVYEVEFATEAGTYRASVDKRDGTVTSVDLLEAAAVEPLTEQQAQDAAEQETGGQAGAVAFDDQNGTFEVTVEKDGAQMSVLVSAADGEVLKITNETEQAQQQPLSILSRDEAVAIAREYLDGDVDDLEFEGTEDGGFYLVTIENDDTDQEVTVQIHAIRGDVMTVEWDD